MLAGLYCQVGKILAISEFQGLREKKKKDTYKVHSFSLAVQFTDPIFSDYV